jgi:short-subunit dehydrogenase
MKTMVIIGAGKLLGMSLAREFGKHNFQIALVARNKQKLLEMKAELEKSGIRTTYHIADIYDKNQIIRVFNEIYHIYGEIDVLEFSPTAGHFAPSYVLEMDSQKAKDSFNGNVVAAIDCVNQVLPLMLQRKEGALLFTTGLSAFYPNPNMAEASIAKAGLRSYILNLQTELAKHNIYVGHISLGLFLKNGSNDSNDPEQVAKYWYEKYISKKVGEEVYPKDVTPETVIK